MEKNKLIYVAFYTNGYYQEVINKYLIPSLKLFNLPYTIYQRNNTHNWVLNGKYKTEIIYDALLKSNSDIVYLDADAEIKHYPHLFYEIPKEYDIAVHYLDWWLFWHNTGNKSKKELLGGTIFFRNNNKVKALVKKWNEDKSVKWKQKLLQELLDKNSQIKVYQLPFDYCKILKQKSIETGTIVHHQASRKLRSGEEHL